MSNQPPSSGPGRTQESSNTSTYVVVGCAVAGCILVMILAVVVAAGLIMYRSSAPAREAVKDIKSQNNLRHIAIGINHHQQTYKRWPASFNAGPDGAPLLSWRVHLLPFLDEEALYKQFRLDEPWDSEHNQKLITLIPEVYLSPFSEAEVGLTTYLGNAVEGGVFIQPADGFSYPTQGLGEYGISDGTANTLLVLEVNDQHAVPWSKPADFDPEMDTDLFNWLNVRDGGELNAAYADGGWYYRGSADDIETFRAELTREGGEVGKKF